MKTSANDKQIVFDSFRLDLSNELLWQGSSAIKVRPKAFALLHYLILRPGQLVTKEELLSAIWPDTFVTDAVLKVTIAQLREALKDDPKSPRFIETAHRRGYRFIGSIAEGGSESGKVRTNITWTSPHVAVVGRDRALSRIHGWLEKMLSGERQIIFVTGEAGIGKTSFVDAFADSVPRDSQIRIGRGQCLEHYGTGEAYLPVLEAIGRLSTEDSKVAEIMRAHAPMWLLQMPSLLSPAERESLHRELLGANRERMLREMGDALTALTVATPLILILEDLHWSDYSTLDLISYLATQRHRAHLMLIGTYRNVELIVTRHPLKAVKQELLAKQQCEELPLEYLSEQAVAEYLSARFPGNRFPKGLAGLIHERTEGNPLFMVNAVDYMVVSELIAEKESYWELVVDLENVEVRVPDNIRQMIDKQIAHLGPAEQRTLEAASVAGMEFSTPALVAGLAENRADVEMRCYELARQRHYIQACGVQELPNGELVTRYGFIHALYQNVLYDRLPLARRVEMHRRIAERGEEVYGKRAPEIAAEFAMHFERGRDYPRATKFLQQAADNAIRRFAYREAVGLARRGLELLEKLPDCPERMSQELCLRLTLGVPLIAIEGYASPKVGKVYLRARELAQLVGTTRDKSETLWGVWTFYVLSAELQTAREIAEEFLLLSQSFPDPDLRTRAHLMMHVTLMHQGEFAPALAHYVKSLEYYRPELHKEDSFFYSQNPGVAIECFGAWTLWFLGHADQAVQCINRAVNLARELSEPHGIAHSLLFAAILHQLRREMDKAREFAEEVISVASMHGLVMYKAQARTIRGWTLLENTSPEEAIAEMHAGLAEYELTHTRLLYPQVRTLLAEGLTKARRFDEGLRELEAAIQFAHTSGDTSYLPEVYRIKGEVLLKRNKHGREWVRDSETILEAERCFLESLRIAQQQNATLWGLRTAVSLADLYSSQDKNPSASALLEDALSQFTEGFETWDLRRAKTLMEQLS